MSEATRHNPEAAEPQETADLSSQVDDLLRSVDETLERAARVMDEEPSSVDEVDVGTGEAETARATHAPDLDEQVEVMLQEAAHRTEAPERHLETPVEDAPGDGEATAGEAEPIDSPSGDEPEIEPEFQPAPHTESPPHQGDARPVTTSADERSDAPLDPSDSGPQHASLSAEQLPPERMPVDSHDDAAAVFSLADVDEMIAEEAEQVLGEERAKAEFAVDDEEDASSHSAPVPMESESPIAMPVVDAEIEERNEAVGANHDDTNDVATLETAGDDNEAEREIDAPPAADALSDRSVDEPAEPVDERHSAPGPSSTLSEPVSDELTDEIINADRIATLGLEAGWFIAALRRRGRASLEVAHRALAAINRPWRQIPPGQQSVVLMLTASTLALAAVAIIVVLFRIL